MVQVQKSISKIQIKM